MSSTVTSTRNPDNTITTETGVTLRISSVDDDASPTAPDTASVFSSIQQTAVALVSAATEQAAQSAARRSAIPNGLRNAVKERHEYAIQRATADQARRAAECARAAVEAIVRHTTQPCLALDETGSIVRWNDALTAWTGIRAESALNHDLAAIFSTEAAEEIHFANLALREAEELPGGVDSDPVFVLEGMFFLQNGFAAERISLLPLCRTPRVVEAIIVLVTPLSQAD